MQVHEFLSFLIGRNQQSKAAVSLHFAEVLLHMSALLLQHVVADGSVHVFAEVSADVSLHIFTLVFTDVSLHIFTQVSAHVSQLAFLDKFTHCGFRICISF